MVENYLDTQKLYSHVCEHNHRDEKDKSDFFSPKSRSEGTTPSLSGKPQLFWVGYVQVRLMVALLGLLQKPGVLWGAAGTPGLAVTPDECRPMGTESP